MNVPVFSLNGQQQGQITVSKSFARQVRRDLIKRAFLAERSQQRQPYGVDPLAGKRTSAHYHGRRKDKWTMMGREMSRLPRIHHQGYLNYTGRFSPHAVKGREAHPPVVERVWKEKINRKERALALWSAIAATADRDLVARRGHDLAGVKHLPLVVVDDLASVRKAKELVAVFKALGLGQELERPTRRKGPLIIVSQDRGVGRAAGSIPGVDVAELESVSISTIAPGAVPGRLCVWTAGALKELESWEPGPKGHDSAEHKAAGEGTA